MWCLCRKAGRGRCTAKVRKFLGPVFHELAGQRRSEILEGHMVQDHVHMLVRILPKYSVADRWV